ncbi:MAG: glycosyltransferase [Paracoccaceae bacterium]
MVLNTIVECMASLGHDVTVAYFGATEHHDATGVLQAHHYVALPRPKLWEGILDGFRWLIFGKPSLNEALYRSRRAKACLQKLANDTRAEVVITDMLRTAQYGAGLGLPWIADLDDLLSRRYATLAAGYNAQSNLLGYYRSRAGRWLVASISWLMPWILRREAASARRREIEVARLAHVTTLVSTSEAQTLALASGRKVYSAPMAVSGPAERPVLTGRSENLVFLGGLDYGPNLKSVMQFDEQIGPFLASSGLEDIKLHVIGQSAGKEAQFSDAVVLKGYVDDMDAAVQSYRVMLVPEVLPGGIKTKIIVAALNGTLVMPHKTALDGMGLRDGKEVLSWDTSADLIHLLCKLRQGDIDVDAITRAARLWAQQNYGAEKLRDIWRDMLEAALDPKGGAESRSAPA